MDLHSCALDPQVEIHRRDAFARIAARFPEEPVCRFERVGQLGKPPRALCAAQRIASLFHKSP
ncbi:MAG TPA: hypothetical protein VM308_09040 [Sphingomicrobium sp.]|nr:hypothetical protein [Sphingomicrobium sp.]